MRYNIRKIHVPNCYNHRYLQLYLSGRVAQSVTCLATDVCLTADPGVASSIPARSHTFVKIDHEIISTVVFIHFKFLGFTNVKINVLDKKKIGCIFIKLKCSCFRTGPGNLKNMKHLKFDIRQIFYTSLKKMKKVTFFENIEIVSNTR